MPSDAGMYFWRAGDELVLFVTGRVTATEAYSMYRHVEGWLEEHPHGSVFVDLDQTNYIDSTTIGTLIRLHKQQRAAGGGFCLGRVLCFCRGLLSVAPCNVSGGSPCFCSLPFRF